VSKFWEKDRPLDDENSWELGCKFFVFLVASRKVFDKNGFKLWKTATQESSESKTGVKWGRSNIRTMRWARDS